MMEEFKISPLLFEKLILPLILGIVGWFVKDYLFAVYARRDQLVRSEWERRLLEIWSPLYYWSGIVMMNDKEKGWQRHGLKELEIVLTKSAHLLPTVHYNNLIKLIQMVTGQKTAALPIRDFELTRQYIYCQIKTFNYLLYRRTGWFESTTYTDFFGTAKHLLRFTSQALKHIVVWLILVTFLGGTYLAYVSKVYWLVAALVAIVSVPILYDVYREIKLHQVLNKQINR